MKRFRHDMTFVLSLVLLLSAFLAAADGPPDYVRASIEKLVRFVGTTGDAAVDEFIDAAMSPQATTNREELAQALIEIRDSAKERSDDVSVERAVDGLNVIFRGPGGATTVHVDIEPDGFVSLRPMKASATQTYSREKSEDEAVLATTSALEQSALEPLDALVAEFESRHFSPEFKARTTPDARRALLAEIREAAGQSAGALIDVRDGAYILILEGPRAVEITFTLTPEVPYLVDSLELIPTGRAPAYTFDESNLTSTFDELGRSGLSGVVYVRLDGRDRLKKAYGTANAVLDEPNRLTTIFGIGSSPIDFTVAGIYLLAQRGELSLDDPVGTFFQNVPTDKRSLNIRHILSGQSGLPDFHDVAGDWDADLAWVDRDEAVRRILTQPLLFEPGTSRRHSHSAFGLLAAIIELVSGQSYVDFLSENFFEPAGMTRTGMYGDTLGYEQKDFAVGGGPSFVGLPNIPPNWGPTSWLVLGSGGMYSTLDDMLRFYELASSDRVLEPKYAATFDGATFSVNGSERGFYLLYLRESGSRLAMMILNQDGRDKKIRAVERALGNFIERR